MTVDQSSPAGLDGATETVSFSGSVARYNISIPDYYRANPDVSALIVGAVVFCGDEILLIQRAASDFAGLKWEVPGGCCEGDKDGTVLSGVARELLEETGLRLRSVRRLVDEADFEDHQKANFTWRKVTFEVDVEEGHTLALAERKAAITAAVRLDPDEHEDWGWATQDEVQRGQWSKGTLDSMLLQRQSILEAFQTRT
ncbi:NUDIX hydrolase domain-containingprotein [Purpureocillium lavendulum]|uniref:NUDIX hydrolase domain-containingprotein n=1 Tax=Purpureocillium lavendulum TaxID=1247861 RepID=A0AB34FW64_9HYPO|nr:NUDIX hydrolase domain-containingprotein [Purpureocillium lavendulum]